MEQGFLIDTNIIGRFLNNRLDDDLAYYIENHNFQTSIISKIELLSWDGFSEKQLKVINQFLNQTTIVYLEETVVIKAIEIRKKYKLKIPDAIIAASALSYNLKTHYAR